MADVRAEEYLPLRGNDRNAEGKERFSTSFVPVVVASLASLCFGFSIGYSSSAEFEIKDIMKNQYILFPSLLGVGAIIGSMLSGFCIEKCGRKTTIMMTALFFTPGWYFISYSSGISYLLIGRLMTGAGAGMSSLAVPIYIAEVSSFQFRGRLGVINQIEITFGIFLAFSIGFYTNHKVTAKVGAALALVMVFLMFFMPESTRWLLAHKRRIKAFKALQWLRGRFHDVEGECCEIEVNLEQQPLVAINDFKTHGLFRPIIIGSLLMMFQQLCGINSMLFFAEQIFQKASIKSRSMTLLMALVQVFMTCLTYFFVDKFGRRKLLMIGSVSMFFCTFILGIYFIVKKDATIGTNTFAQDVSWVALLCFVIYIINYSIGWGPLPWLLMSEIFPLRARGFGSSIVTCINWTFVFIVTMSFDGLVSLIKEYGTLWLYSVFCFISFLFVFYFVPETRGKTLEDIEHYYLIYHGFRNRLN